jgi:hypothetical protein
VTKTNAIAARSRVKPETESSATAFINAFWWDHDMDLTKNTQERLAYYESLDDRPWDS